MKTISNTKIITDESMMELFPHGSDEFPFQYYYEDIRQFENEYVAWHWHSEFEFMSVKSGRVNCHIGNIRHSLKEGDGIFINSGIIHSFEAPEEGIIPNILFSPKFLAPEDSLIYKHYLEPLVNSDKSHMVFKQEVSWQSRVLSLLNQIYFLCDRQETAWELDVQSLAGRILALLSRHKETFVTIEKAGVTPLSQARLKRMTLYIEQHYSEKITLQDIANSADISKSEALRCFKNGVQASPFEYLNRYRLHLAKPLLTNTSRTITDVAESVGFESISYFDRLFKRAFGVTPKSLRKSAGSS